MIRSSPEQRAIVLGLPPRIKYMTTHDHHTYSSYRGGHSDLANLKKRGNGLLSQPVDVDHAVCPEK